MKFDRTYQSSFLLRTLLLGTFLLGILSMNAINASANSDSLSATEATPPWASMNLVGKGKLSVLFWDIYNAELYTADGTYKQSQYPIALRLVYLRDFEKNDLITETQKQWKKLGFKDREKITTWVASLDKLWRNVKKHESITLYINETSQSFFYLDSEQLGQVEDPEFAQAFLDIWLSENTSAPDVRKKLISGKNV